MLRKRTLALTLSCIISGQVLLAPVAGAITVDEAVNNLIEKNTTYENLVTKQLNLDKNEADSFVRGVVKDLNVDTSKLNDQDYINQIKNKVTSEALKNPAITNAITDVIKNQGYDAAKNAARDLANAIIKELKTTTLATGGAGGGGGGDLSKEEFKITFSGTTAEVSSGSKQYINVSGPQLKDLQNRSKVLTMHFEDTNLSFTNEALNISELIGQEKTMLQVQLKKVSPSESQKLMITPEGNKYKVVGNVYGLKAMQIDSSENVSDITSFKGKVTISLPVPVGSKESADQGDLKAYVYNEKSATWELVGGTYNSAKSEMSFETNHFSVYALLEKVAQEDVANKLVANRFNDINGHWAVSDIEYMANKGYVKGIGEGNFGPEQSVTRAEFAAMLVNVLGITEQGVISFKDVATDSWYHNSVAKVYKAGLAKGKGVDTFDPQESITRQEMAAMLSNALKYQGKQSSGDVSQLSLFQDNQLIDDWAKQAVADVLASKIINGKPSTQGVIFAPQDRATRAEAVVMLRNLLDK